MKIPTSLLSMLSLSLLSASAWAAGTPSSVPLQFKKKIGMNIIDCTGSELGGISMRYQVVRQPEAPAGIGIQSFEMVVVPPSDPAYEPIVLPLAVEVVGISGVNPKNGAYDLVVQMKPDTPFYTYPWTRVKNGGIQLIGMKVGGVRLGVPEQPDAVYNSVAAIMEVPSYADSELNRDLGMNCVQRK